MSEVIVLDTHIWLWLVNGNTHLFPQHWQDRFETALQLAISPLSYYEVALSHQKGRIQLPGTVQDWFVGALAPACIDLLPLTKTIAAQVVAPSPIHKDPFDRLIMSTALVYGARLASVDTLFPRCSELQGCLIA